MEVLKPDKEFIKTVDEILSQNRMIIETNSLIAKMLLQPAICLSENERGMNYFKVPEVGEIIYKNDS